MPCARPQLVARAIAVLAALLCGAAAAAAGPARVNLAPYVPVKLGPDLVAWSAATGQTRAVLAFYNGDPAAPEACRGAWPVDEAVVVAQVQAFHRRGGTVIVSSGGWNGDDLARRCPNAQALADAYAAALDRVQTDHLDLDIEGGDRLDNLDPGLVERRSAALRLLQDQMQARGRRLDLTLTLAVAPAHGLDARSLSVLASAEAGGVRVAAVNALLMNYHDGGSGPAAQRGIAALQALRNQLAVVIPGRSDRAYWRMIAATPMIGQNDSPGEVFTLADVPVLAAFARQIGLARVGFWSLARDNGDCAGAPSAAPTCSGLAQPPWAFTRAFAQALGS